MADISPDRSGHLEHGPHRIWWEHFGDGDREAVVLLNGLAMHTKAWYGFLDQLRPEFDVLLYDYLGQGDWRPVVALCLGALLCGFFWELWNYYSYPKWTYFTPGVDFWYIFEMPLVGSFAVQVTPRFVTLGAENGVRVSPQTASSSKLSWRSS